NSLFGCGCQGIWAAAGKFCNIHTAGVPHCPWCATGAWGAFLPRTLIILTQIGIVFLPSKISNTTRLILGVIAFAAVATAVGALFAIQTHYPTFLTLSVTHKT